MGGLGDGDVIPYMMGMALVGAYELGMLVEACWRYTVGWSVGASPVPHAEARAKAHTEAARGSLTPTPPKFYGCYVARMKSGHQLRELT